jgi:DNA replication protein DnaC
MDHPAYLAATGKTPHWAELPCEGCERHRMMDEIEERAGAGERGRLGRLLADSLLQRRFAGKTFENFRLYGDRRDRQEKILAHVRSFANDFARHLDAGTWLLFVGNTGTGKGHLCAAIINRIIQAGWSALFTKTPRLLREIKETFNRDTEVTQSEILRRMGALDLLIIDEVGVQFGTDTERMILYEVLDLRYEAMLPVILTSNVRNLKTLEKLLGERIIDRLFEGESRILFFDWESYRRFNHPGTNEGIASGSSPALFSMGGKMR